jgi:Domain of unknown function (DUF4150)
MSHEVYAGKWEIAGESGMNKSIARFPDVCLSPPSPPAGPIPVPYPDTSFSSDLKKGSKTVKLGGKAAALAQQSYYKPSVLGDEAATRTFGANVVTHQITGKTYFQAWSMDVKIEGKNVCRHFDITTSNHASIATTVVGTQSIEAASLARIEAGRCPCCDGKLHDNQKGADGKPLEPRTQEQYYRKKKEEVDKKSAGYPDWAKENPARVETKMELQFGLEIFGVYEEVPKKIADEEARRAQVILDELTELTAANPDCPNLHNPQNKDCGVHFDLPREQNTKAQRTEFERKYRKQFVEHWDAANPSNPVPKHAGVNHMTPLDAGGCPSGGGEAKGFPGLVPDHILSGPCAEIETRQRLLQGRKVKVKV